jgi:hypothetical protein
VSVDDVGRVRVVLRFKSLKSKGNHGVCRTILHVKVIDGERLYIYIVLRPSKKYRLESKQNFFVKIHKKILYNIDPLVIIYIIDNP